MQIPAKLENEINQFEQVRTQLQMLSNQKMQMSSALKEIQGALEELDKVKKGANVYKNVGSLLVQVKDTKALVVELKEKEETLDVRVNQLEKQEKVLNEKFVTLQETIQKAFQEGQ